VTAIQAHRGTHDQARENSIPAFLASHDIGIDGVELDVRRTLDGVLVVHHDAHVAGRAIHLTRAGDLPSYIATLDAALDALQGLHVNVEIKNIADESEPVYDATGDFTRQVMAALAARSGDDTSISSFDLATCRLAQELNPDTLVGYLVWQTPFDVALAACQDNGLRALNPHYRLIGPGEVARATAAGVALNLWTVNSDRRLQEFFDLGVATVITDHPQRAAELRRAGRATGQ
jgi:glycerophosphoryl diester phosphodiesterase